jgi:hypothetical protein
MEGIGIQAEEIEEGRPSVRLSVQRGDAESAEETRS